MQEEDGVTGGVTYDDSQAAEPTLANDDDDGTERFASRACVDLRFDERLVHATQPFLQARTFGVLVPAARCLRRRQQGWSLVASWSEPVVSLAPAQYLQSVHTPSAVVTRFAASLPMDICPQPKEA